ncbi:MAG: hypothetical protein KJO07_20395 [Deltaproteobacteria bacterium]|nr:hypothetical protein [Deltaproteobacteria bacterium]
MRRSVILLAFACACGSAQKTEKTAEPGPCSIAVLESFDPGGRVVDRQIERVRRTGAFGRRERLVVTKCTKEEAEPDCTERGRKAALAAYPDAKVTVEIDHQSQWLGVYEVDGKKIEKTYPTSDDMVAEMTKLKDAGKEVLPVSGKQEPVEDGEVRAIAKAVVDSGVDTDALELRLTLVFEGQGPAAAKRMADRADAAGLTVSRLEARPGGGFEARLSCTRTASGSE